MECIERGREGKMMHKEREAKLCAYNFSIVRVRAHKTCLHYMLVLNVVGWTRRSHLGFSTQHMF